jgi:hypothetical protein
MDRSATAKSKRVCAYDEWTSVSNMMNGQPFTIANSYLIRAMEFFRFEVKVFHVRSDMMSCTGVWIPSEIRTMRRS